MKYSEDLITSIFFCLCVLLYSTFSILNVIPVALGKDIELADVDLSFLPFVFCVGLSRLFHQQRMHHTSLLCLSCQCPSPFDRNACSTLWLLFTHTDFVMCHHPCFINVHKVSRPGVLTRLYSDPEGGLFRACFDTRFLQRAARVFVCSASGSHAFEKPVVPEATEHLLQECRRVKERDAEKAAHIWKLVL